MKGSAVMNDLEQENMYTLITERYGKIGIIFKVISLDYLFPIERKKFFLHIHRSRTSDRLQPNPIRSLNEGIIDV